MKTLRRWLRVSGEARAVFTAWAFFLVCGGWGSRGWQDAEPIPAPPPHPFRLEE
jgi:hypothetical protein